jgi:hypothetical protein
LQRWTRNGISGQHEESWTWKKDLAASPAIASKSDGEKEKIALLNINDVKRTPVSFDDWPCILLSETNGCF